MDGIKKLLDSSTFAFIVLGFVVHYATGGMIPVDAILTAAGIYGGKEAIRHVANAIPQKPVMEVVKPDGADS